MSPNSPTHNPPRGVVREIRQDAPHLKFERHNAILHELSLISAQRVKHEAIESVLHETRLFPPSDRPVCCARAALKY